MRTNRVKLPQEINQLLIACDSTEKLYRLELEFEKVCESFGRKINVMKHSISRGGS